MLTIQHLTILTVLLPRRAVITQYAITRGLPTHQTQPRPGVRARLTAPGVTATRRRALRTIITRTRRALDVTAVTHTTAAGLLQRTSMQRQMLPTSTVTSVTVLTQRARHIRVQALTHRDQASVHMLSTCHLEGLRMILWIRLATLLKVLSAKTVTRYRARGMTVIRKIPARRAK